MELKNYQKKVINNLSSYLEYLNETNTLFEAWEEYWTSQDVLIGLGGAPSYNNTIAGVPHVCMKVPTGGGKTFIAISTLKTIFDAMPLDKPKVVVWLVPTDAILSQTIKNLSDINHPYRKKLDLEFSGRVGVYTKDELLNGQNFSPETVQEILSICVLSYNSLRIDSTKKDVRKVYQENGNLFRFLEYFKEQDSLLADTPETALIQVLRQLEPVSIVDESHNAESDLSVEMLKKLNPSFLLDLTATPRKNSNIISYVDARELKGENMVKLPVVVYHRNSRQNVIQDALQLRASIEKQAIEEEQQGGEYIRPIILFQAQPKNSSDSETFDRIKLMLTEMGIPDEEIAIKTSGIDELANINLMSRDCKIRYIITVNALKEGWDCPFAYILASLANKQSTVDVEQILGRILRQPYGKRHNASLLNTSYVLTCSNDFHATLDKIVIGLNKAGFTRKDYRIGQLSSVSDAETQSKLEIPQVLEPAQQSLWGEMSKFDGRIKNDLEVNGNKVESQIDQENHELENLKNDLFEDIIPESVKAIIEEKETEALNYLEEMIKQATEKTKNYIDKMNEEEASQYHGGDLGEMLNQNAVQSQFIEEVRKLCIPQFFLKSSPNLFGEEYELLEHENLSEGFSLSGQDAQISFELATGEIYSVDIQEEGDAIPKYKRASKNASEYFRKFLAKMPPETKINHCIEMICSEINKNNRYASSEIQEYVRRIVGNMTEDELAAMEISIPFYSRKILEKVKGLEDVYKEKQFYKWIDSGKIVCRENYILPMVITPVHTIDSIPCSLYDAESNKMNNFERRVIDILVDLDNIKWWHRIIERKGFRINGFMNHYPDFMIRTKSGKIILIEAKGDYYDGEDSVNKLKLGRKWQTLSGDNYRYFMVFESRESVLDGAYTLDNIVSILKEL